MYSFTNVQPCSMMRTGVANGHSPHASTVPLNSARAFLKYSCQSTVSTTYSRDASSPGLTSPATISLCNIISRQFPCGKVDNRRDHVAARATRSNHSYPFSERDFLRVTLLHGAPYGPMKLLPGVDNHANTYNGVLVFHRDGEQSLNTETPVLEVFVAGDTACNIYTLLNGHQSSRPMIHDLMHTVLCRAAEVSPRHWQLLRVAIVGLENNIFVGRLFFGDAASGLVMWDCDCRPSDGVFLSLRTGCPFYVGNQVWREAAVPIRLSQAHMIAVHEAQMAAVQQQQQSPHESQSQQKLHHYGPATSTEMGTNGLHGGGLGGGLQLPTGGAPEADLATPSAEYTTIKPKDPVAIKLLKRELAVAVHEEDYAAAIRLRDHPYLLLYRRSEVLQAGGRQEEAEQLRRQLAQLIKTGSDGASNTSSSSC